jgi:hypothetical protein
LRAWLAILFTPQGNAKTPQGEGRSQRLEDKKIFHFSFHIFHLIASMILSSLARDSMKNKK